MSRICVFPPNATLKEIFDHSRHQHINRAQVDAGEARGELIRFDVKGNQYVASGRVGVGSPSLPPYPHLPPHPGPSQKVIAAAALGERWACRLVENFDAELLPIEHVRYDEHEVWFNTSRGKPVWVLLKRRRAEVVKECKQFLARSGELPLSESAKLREIVSGLPRERAEIFKRERAEILKRVWPSVFVQFHAVTGDRRDPRDAGARFMAHLSATPPEDLPGAIAYWVIRAYTRRA